MKKVEPKRAPGEDVIDPDQSPLPSPQVDTASFAGCPPGVYTATLEFVSCSACRGTGYSGIPTAGGKLQWSCMSCGGTGRRPKMVPA